ncbi:hypothetical protein [Flexivirga meconopsidis]|uniref:hypothetical protein n=1 Tax=Flexivirga meconopsidis TaxID=2977121 RepID=UPI00223FBCD2|nr:hypothetical protein [Flexivirga meconopsidis]
MLAWATLVSALVAAIASVVGAWRQWWTWSVDRRTKRFEDALARALSDNDREAEIGRAQLAGMVRRGELRRRDSGWVDDTIARALGDPPAGSGNEDVLAPEPRLDDDGVN